MYPSYFYRKFTQKFHSTPLKDSAIGGRRVVSTTFLKLPNNWAIYTGDNVCYCKKHSDIVVFLDSNLSFTIRLFPCGLANDLYAKKI